MAKKDDSPKIVLERVYNVPLRREFLKVGNWKRTKKAVRALRQFIAKHMKSEEVHIGKYANLFLWQHGIKNPPHHIKVNAAKDDTGKVTVELAELPPRAKREMEKQKEIAKKKEDEKKHQEKAKKAETETKAEKIGEKVEEAKKEKEEQAKEVQKEEIKEMQKEHPKIHVSKQTMDIKQSMKHPTAPKSV